MNLLFLTNKSSYFGKPFGGAESSIELLAAELGSRGHRVFHVTRMRDNAISIKRFSKILNGVHVSALSFLDRLTWHPWIAGLQEAWAKRIVQRLIHTQRIDLVYCFYELNNLDILIALKSRFPKLKIVMRMAGMKWNGDCLADPRFITKYTDVFNQVDGVNFIHQDLQSMVAEALLQLKMNVRFRHVIVGDIGSSAPIGRVQPYSLGGRQHFDLIMASRFSDLPKRQDLLIDSISRVDTAIPIRLVLIGSGPKFSDLHDKIKRTGQTNRISMEQFSHQQDLWNRMLKADLLCHASDHEGLSKIIIESMALGLPVLASNVPPLNGYIVDGENGFLVDNDPQHWAERITALYHHVELRAAVSERAIRFIDADYNPKRNVQLYEQHFEQILAESPA